MFMGLDRDVWISMWAGSLGAIPAAVISAFVAARVAVTVLNRSTVHQQRLASEQLAEQRGEASRTRERAALADVIFAVEAVLMAAVNSPGGIDDRIAVVQSAMARWRIEVGLSPMQSEIMNWSVLLVVATEDCIKQKRRGGTEEAEAAVSRLREVAAQITVVALAWPDSDADERKDLWERLTMVRGDLARDLPEATIAHP